LLVHGENCDDTDTARAARQRRQQMGVASKNGIILVRETSQDMHGGLPLKELLASCPGNIGCTVHVKSYDGKCAQCAECPFNTCQAMRDLAAMGDAGRATIDWVRFYDYKLVCLKQIVQQMLLAELPQGVGAGARSDACQVWVPREIESRRFQLPGGAGNSCARVVLHRGCYLSDELPALLKGVIGNCDRNFQFVFPSGDEAAGKLHFQLAPGESVCLLVVVRAGAFTDPRLARSIHSALKRKVRVVLLHYLHLDCYTPFCCVLA
jgi:hypothetical protein